MWRISSTVDIEHRLKIDGGRPLFAWLDFRLMPSEDADFKLSYDWLEPADERWNSAIQEALIAFVNKRRDAGRTVGYTWIEMRRVISHPIDTDEHAVAYNMERALEMAFRNHETNADPSV